MDDRDTKAASAVSGTPAEWLLNFARGAKGIALLLFLAPWLTVSCAGRPLISMSGFELATGTVGPPDGLPAEAMTMQSQSPDWLVALAALLIVAGIAVTFLLRRRAAALAAMAACGAALAILVYEVPIRIRGLLQDSPERQGAPDGSAGNSAAPANDFQQQVGQVITVDIQIWFWLTLAALVAAIVLLKMVHGRSDGHHQHAGGIAEPSGPP